MRLALQTLYSAAIFFLLLNVKVDSMVQFVQCYSCNGATSPQDCTTTVPCVSLSECYSAERNINGIIHYYAGCATPGLCSGGVISPIYHNPCYYPNYPVLGLGQLLQRRALLCNVIQKRRIGQPVYQPVYGLFQDYTCCNGDHCNGKTLLKQTTTTTTTTTTIPTRSCYRCYDTRLDDQGRQHPCYNVATCSSIASQCSTVYRKEHDIVTVDMDCGENLKYRVGNSGVQQICSVTCDGDRCNKNQDCRNAV